MLGRMWPFQRNRSHRIRSSGPYWLLQQWHGRRRTGAGPVDRVRHRHHRRWNHRRAHHRRTHRYRAEHRDAGCARSGARQHGGEHRIAAVRDRHASDRSWGGKSARSAPRAPTAPVRPASNCWSGAFPSCCRRPTTGGAKACTWRRISPQCRCCAPSSRPADSSALRASGSRARSCNVASVVAGPAESSRRWQPRSIR